MLLALFQYHLAGNEDYLPEIEKALMEKLDSMVKRELYTTFKTAPTEEEREKAREVIAEAEQAKKNLVRIRAEAKTEELKNSATKTAAAALNGINSLLGGNKVSRLEKEKAQLYKEVDELNGQIERLHSDMQKLKDNHKRELNRTIEQHQQEVSNLKRIIDKAYKCSQVSNVSSTWNVSVWSVASTWNRPTN